MSLSGAPTSLPALELEIDKLRVASKCESTWKQYAGAWAKFAQFCISNDLEFLPATSRTVSLYIANASLEGSGVSPVQMAMASISAYHERFDLPSPTRSPGVLTMLKGYKKSKGRMPTQAKAMSKKVLKKFIRKTVGKSMRPAGSGNEELGQWRAAWLESTAFATLSRFSDLQRLRRKDLTITKNMVTIRFDSRKNDAVHKGHFSYLFATGGEYCPVRLTRKYLDQLPRHEDTFLLPAISNGHAKEEAASYGACRKAQVEILKKIGEDHKIYGLHSGRVGGAVHLANAGVSFDIIGLMGGWALGSLMPMHYARQAEAFRAKMADFLNIENSQ
jgi:integrase